jgi:hypothetical protein
VNINGRLLAEAKLIAAREHRTIGSVLEDALRTFIEGRGEVAVGRGDFVLHTFVPDEPGVLPGVDLEDKELMAELLGDNSDHAPA